MLRVGIFGAMVLSRANAYMLPEENSGHMVFADTRIADPRYARSAEELMCVHDTNDPIPHPFTPTGNRPPKERMPNKQIPIGCCPEGDPFGKPYGPGKSCCCGTVYDEITEMCCEETCSVYANTLQGITHCNMDIASMGTEAYNPTKSVPEPTPTSWQNPNPPPTPEDPFPSGMEEVGKCPQAWYLPSPMEASCTDFNNEGSFCAFTCPANLKVRIPDNPNRVCHDEVWQGDVPQCCERDGCPSDLRVDFFFILDSSSSIKDKNFQYVREYVIGLISTMPVGLDKTRVGILTYNNDVIHRVRLNQFDKKSALMEAVNNIPYEGRGTKTNAALEYAVDIALTEENGDRPDVPNFVLVLTDGRSTDDVRIGAPRLRAKAAVIAVGVGRRIEKKELEHIAGDEGNVFMVADFRSMTGSNSEGSTFCADKIIANAYEEEGSTPAPRRRRDDETDEYEGDATIEERLEQLAVELAELQSEFEAGIISQAEYYSSDRRLKLLREQLNREAKLSSAELISGKGPGKGKGKGNKRPKEEDTDNITCPDISGEFGSHGVGRFTTSFICPKSCIWESYALYYPDDLLNV